MDYRLHIRPALREDRETILRFRGKCMRTGQPSARVRAPAGDLSNLEPRLALRPLTDDRCLLLARTSGRLVATNGVDLDAAEMVGLLVDPDFRGLGIGRRMVAAAERLAVRFGMTDIGVLSPATATPFFVACGYRPVAVHAPALIYPEAAGAKRMERKFPRRQTRYGRRIRRLHREMGIPDDYGRRHRLTLQEESRELATVSVGDDGREHLLLPAAAEAWHAMRTAAAADDVRLQVASAYRSVGYQVSLIERKKQRGQAVDEILKVSAAPGFSEHHTGRAIDVTTPGTRPLEQDFEETAAFEWLAENACRHGFRLSYPRNNRHGIAYEPWHWFFEGR